MGNTVQEMTKLLLGLSNLKIKGSNIFDYMRKCQNYAYPIGLIDASNFLFTHHSYCPVTTVVLYVLIPSISLLQKKKTVVLNRHNDIVILCRANI